MDKRVSGDVPAEASDCPARLNIVVEREEGEEGIVSNVEALVGSICAQSPYSLRAQCPC